MEVRFQIWKVYQGEILLLFILCMNVLRRKNSLIERSYLTCFCMLNVSVIVQAEWSTEWESPGWESPGWQSGTGPKPGPGPRPNPNPNPSPPGPTCLKADLKSIPQSDGSHRYPTINGFALVSFNGALTAFPDSASIGIQGSNFPSSIIGGLHIHVGKKSTLRSMKHCCEW